MRKVLIKKTFIAVFMVVLLVASNIITYSYTKYYIKKEELKTKQNASISIEAKQKDTIHIERFAIDSKRVENIKNVMIVAHPDDETLWGGNHLREDDYLVLCLTNGDNKIRRKEFFKTLEKTGDYGIMLDYPDNPNHIKSKWEVEKDDIKKDIEYIVNYKDWDQIVTHNPEGEYGHIHHKFTNKMVTESCVASNLTSKLMYFGKYYKKNELIKTNLIASLNEEQSLFKHEIMRDIYKSQCHAYEIFAHMIPYENYISYSDWYFGI